MKMTANLHTHTFRCRHASGTEREYIENAVAAGLSTYGFADHAPYAFPEGYYSGFRMLREAQEDYVTTLTALREEYKDRIAVKIGYEAEYYPRFFADFLRLITRFPVDYLILGQHFLLNEVEGKYSGSATEQEDDLALYVDQTSEAMRTGVFTYFAHPDLLNYRGNPAVYEKHMSRLIECAKETDTPLEINLLGIRDHRHYPNEPFFRLCGEIGAPVCMGCDAHSADVAVDSASFETAMELCGRYGLAFVPSPALRPVPASL